MPYKKPNIEKIHYSIGEVAKMLNVTPSLLRYWEKEFNIIKPYKNAKGDRFYTSNDIQTLKLLYHLIKEKKFTIQGAKQYLKNKTPAQIEINTLVINKLLTIKEELLILKNLISDFEKLNLHEQKEK